MTTAVATPVSGPLHALLDAALADDMADELAGLTPAELVRELALLGAAAARLSAVQSRLLAVIESRRLDGDFDGTRTTSDLLGAAQPVTPKAATDAVHLALSLTPRRSLTGEPLSPLAPGTARAFEGGRVTSDQARVIVDTLDDLPGWLTFEDARVVEQVLVDAAAFEHPAALRTTARQLLARLDQDGTEPSADERPERRRLRIVRRRNGMQRVIADLSTAEVAIVTTVLDPLAAPRPSEDGTPDPRSAAERGADAFVEVFERLLRSGTLPHCGGAPVTVLATTTLAELQAGHGLAYTDRGDPWPIPDLVEVATEADIVPVITDDAGAVLRLGRTQRLASAAQRRALAARDRGCCFPGCDRPAPWTQVHHVVDWALGGPTDVDNMCLLCRYHHRNFEALGWRVAMRAGLPEWSPPPWLDARRRPRRNTTHHPPALEFERRARTGLSNAS